MCRPQCSDLSDLLLIAHCSMGSSHISCTAVCLCDIRSFPYVRTKTEAWRWTEVRSRIWTTLLCCRPRIGISDSYRPYTEVYSRNPETRAEKDSYTTHYTLAHSYIKLYTPQNIAAAVITNRKRSVGLADPKFVPDIVHLSPGTSPASSPGSSLHGACCMLTIAFQL